RVLVREGVARPRGSRAGQVLAAGNARQAKGVEEGLLPAHARETAGLIRSVAEVEAHPSCALRKGEKVDVSLRADHLGIGGPAVRALDQHAGEEMVLRIAVQLDAELAPDLRSAPIGADDQAAARGLPRALVLIADLGHAAELDAHVLHPA